MSVIKSCNDKTQICQEFSENHQWDKLDSHFIVIHNPCKENSVCDCALTTYCISFPHLSRAIQHTSHEKKDQKGSAYAPNLFYLWVQLLLLLASLQGTLVWEWWKDKTKAKEGLQKQLHNRSGCVLFLRCLLFVEYMTCSQKNCNIFASPSIKSKTK